MAEFYEALRQALPQYGITPINEGNYAIARDVYFTNPEYFMLFGQVADDERILTTVRMLPEGFDIARKFFAGLCENGKAIAVIDLLMGYPNENEMWIGLFLVHGDFHGKGVGAAVFNGTARAARMVGLDSIHLGIFDTNKRALHFWQKMGFTYERTKGDFLVYQRSVHETL
ncbi:MAG: GNAT family N-acetyltransferase [Clostridiales bacterium]|nr:GNAT family N-acetyltransferase [Clostridiales bacterium]